MKTFCYTKQENFIPKKIKLTLNVFQTNAWNIPIEIFKTIKDFSLAIKYREKEKMAVMNVAIKES